VDYGKHVTYASTISLAILALGFTALYAAWIFSDINQTLPLYNHFEQILVARNILVERPWNDGAEVTIKDVVELDAMLSFNAKAFPVSCKRTGGCEDEERQRKAFYGLTLKEMQLKLPRARKFDLAGVRSEYATSCSAIFFRGKDDETFWIYGASTTVVEQERPWVISYSLTPGVNLVQGSLIYYVELSHECRFSSKISFSAFSFFLIDLRSIGKGWNFHAPEGIMRGMYADDEVGYRIEMDKFKKAEAWYDKNLPNASFDKERFFEPLPDSYRKLFAGRVPSKFLTMPINGIESRIIGTAYVKTSTLYNSSELDKAISATYNFERLSPTVGGVGTNFRLFTSIAPILLLGFSFFFWYHVKRIVRSDAPYNDPWILLDAEGFIEKGFVVVWAALLVLTPAAITWALLANYNAHLPRIEAILAWVNRNPAWQEILEYWAISVPALLGGIVIVVGELFIVHSLHLLLKRGSGLYSRLCTRIKSWFDTCNRAARFWARRERTLLSEDQSEAPRKPRGSKGSNNEIP
jgi:hypothetical protein